MPAIYHEGSWLGNATDPEVLVKDTVGWTGKNRAYSQTNNAVIAHIENGITYDVSWTGSATVTLKKNSASGATITSGSTSPLSFTADADYELYFGSSATVTNIMVKDSRITDPTYEPYHESVEVMYEEEIHGVNLLNNVGPSKTINGVTFTVNADGSVTANGTATAQCWFSVKDYLLNPLHLDAGSYFVNGCSGGSSSTHSIRLTNGASALATSYNGETAFNLSSSSDSIGVYIVIGSNQTVSNLVFKPMIRLATIEDNTYRPYNPQAIQNQLNAQGVLGAKNLLPNNATSQTVNGVTFTKNADGSVTANGTATAPAELVVCYDLPSLYGGRYILSGCPSGGAITKYRITAYRVDSIDGQSGSLFDIGNGLEFTYKNTTGNARFIIYIENGVTVSNLTFKPMLRLASDPDDTYQPYAMTNRELTEIVQGTVTSNFTWNGSIEKCGRTVMLNFSVATGTSSVAANTQLAAVPFKPKNNVFFFVRSNIDSSIRLAEMNTSGQIAINSALSNGGNLIGSVMYFS